MAPKSFGRKSLDQALDDIEEDVCSMASYAKECISASIPALEEHDEDLINKIKELEVKTDELDLEIEKKCMETIALQQPVASDLRFIASMMKISDEFERICDLANKIAEIAEKRGEKPVLKPLIDCRRMAEETNKMIDTVMKKVEEESSEGLRDLEEKDDYIDKLFDQVKNELIGFMVKNPKTIDDATNMTFVARYIERAADIVLKIASRLIYTFEGKRIQLK